MNCTCFSYIRGLPFGTKWNGLRKFNLLRYGMNYDKSAISLNLMLFRISAPQDLHRNFSSTSFCQIKTTVLSSEQYLEPGNKTTNDNSLEVPINDEKIIEIQKWVEMYRDEGGETPESLTREQTVELILLKTFHQRRKYLRFLSLNEFRKGKDKMLKERKFEAKLKRHELRDQCHIIYGLWQNTMFIKTIDRNMRKFYNGRVHHAIRSYSAQPIVIDCSFQTYMNRQEANSMAEQIKLTSIQNRAHLYPFDIHLCYADKDDRWMKSLKQRVPTAFDPEYPLNVHTKSYLDLFPRKRLVYLSPNSRNVMKKLDPDAVYIVGGIVDKGEQLPLTLSKAKKERITVEKLPLDDHMVFRGQKSLAIHVVFAILLDLQISGDWQYALRNIPRRLIVEGQYTEPSPWDAKPRDRSKRY